MAHTTEPADLPPGGVDPAGVASDDTPSLKSARIMMVDDEPITLDVVQAFLEEAGYENFLTTSEPVGALELAANERPDVVLLDLMMPVVSGFDILKGIRSDANLRHIPVIVLTSSTDAATKLKALEMGATDFLAKPVDASELVLRLRNTLAAKAYLDRLAYFDRLTGLYNRQMFNEHLDRTLRLAKRHDRIGALLHINIDKFRKINEALGPAHGDELLQAVAKRLEHGIRTSDSVARIGGDTILPRLSRVGGDEFAVLLVDVDKIERTAEVVRRLLELMCAPFRVRTNELFVTCSIGVSVFPNDGLERDTLAKNATVALRSAKQGGGNAHRFYSADMNDRAVEILSLQGELRRAIERRELLLFYQPKIEATTRQPVAAEALLRWQHPRRGLVGPGEFISLAEETGLIVDIGAWILEDVCRQIVAWGLQGLAVPTVAVNISARQFAEKNFLGSVHDTLNRHPVSPGSLQIEVTESILMSDAGLNIRTLEQLKAFGLKLSMDDFGTGYSSLSYLRRFPIDELKIDRSFVMDIDAAGKANSRPIIAAIIVMARGLALKVVAEGVETEAQWEFLREQGCDQGQGYLFGRPMPAAELAKLLPAR
ncbi:MAG: putative bifunctional diguanylate cyclase/phosphodiesterase [Burkholderiales bacterium]